jgi:uncharacterized protein YndB with AHSA1/START domain
MIATVQCPAALQVSRIIHAPRERVFAAWTTAADILKWFGAEGCHVRSVAIHPQPGGEYRFSVSSENSGELEVHGIFREVSRPWRLVFTWNWSGNPALEFGSSIVSVEFLEQGGATEVRIRQDRLPSDKLLEDHRHGWSGCLDQLEKLVSEGDRVALHSV